MAGTTPAGPGKTFQVRVRLIDNGTLSVQIDSRLQLNEQPALKNNHWHLIYT